ncbi:MAG: hypothetical protein QNJ47_16475 [Nostocaceae cyanobacterium]|nr:hypothetical protein [Nostocaceae cyanobacterium]
MVIGLCLNLVICAVVYAANDGDLKNSYTWVFPILGLLTLEFAVYQYIAIFKS